MGYKIQLVAKNGRILNESRIAKSKAQLNKWLPAWRTGKKEAKMMYHVNYAPKVRVVETKPKKRAIHRHHPFQFNL